ncbi:calmodulin-regulated spectrin-associated protein 3-like isoform X2 [Girardinichthys multiradiatus]|uniref:calmodulin-regulated spectrin-associated protein 3-like isoform X2 n=1 Tax=Girardinichthys multiradiatus TaxID=208333 RepID=UPI001FAD650B|nr:calmodulin-regulated spectrin-associated protein 3-like isoform X2 [Girardinichthys multiradiatus]
MVDSPTKKKTFLVRDIKPLDLYDCSKSKICASVGWLLAKSYGSSENVPAELRDPFYCDQYEQEHLKPPVTRLLQSSELYCRTYSIIIGSTGSEAQPKDNIALLQLLTQRGIVAKDQEATVTEADLQHKPIKMSAHLAVIDALMTVGAIETVTAVKTCGSADLLDGAASWEDALLHWVNALNQKLRERTEGAQNDSPQSAAEPQPVEPSLRYRKDKIPFKVKPIFPEVKEVKDLSSGCALAAVIHYYYPGLLRLEDVSMKDSMSAADSLYNLQFIREFCDSCLKGCCHLALEDMLYTPQELQLNFLSFLSELLYWLEVQRPEFVQPIDTLDGSTPVTQHGISGNSTSPSIFKKPFLPISSSASGPLTQSTSMSHIEGVGKTWSKKPLSRPLSAVSFSIPFGLDSDVDIVMGNPVITRSMSSDQLNPAGQNMNQKYTPAEDISHLVGKAPGPNGPQRASWASQTPVIPRLAEENGLETSETGELPTIEEALQIIHNEGKMEPRLHPDGAPDGFYLHSPDDSVSSRYDSNLAPISCSAPTRSGMMYQPKESMEPVRTRNTSGCSRDDDSVLRDGSVDSDALEDLPKAQSTPNTPASRANSVIGYIKDAPDSGVKMTNFAERKKRHNMDSPKASDPSSAQVTTWAQKSEESPSKSPQLNNEMSELGARLEEKRKAIEAQKKRIEAIFAKHRQKLGERAFIQLKNEQYEVGSGEKGENGQVSASSTEEDLSCLALEEGLARMEEEKEQAQQRPFVAYDLSVGEGPVLIKEGSQFKEKAALPGPKSSGTPGEKMGAPLGDYNNAVSKLTAALSSLQTDMQRLSDQQNQLVKKTPAASTNQSWVIPAKPKPSSPAPPRLSRESTRGLNVTSSSPSPSRKMTNHTAPPKSQVHRRAQSVPPKSPKHSRQMDTKFPTLSRVLTPPQNVDRIPHLRRVNPWQSQVQTSSSFSIGDSGSLDELRSFGATPIPTPSLTPIPTPPPHTAADDTLSEVGSNDGQSIFSMDMEAGRFISPLIKKEGLASAGCSSGAPSECSFESEAPAGVSNGNRSSLIESSLSALGAEKEEDDQVPDALSDSMSDRTEPEWNAGVVLFFKDDKDRPEDEMAQRKKALLDKQQRRTEEMKRRKLEQEKEKESNKPQWMIIEGWSNKNEETPQTPTTPPAEGTPQRRGDFTRQEYERRQQLKIMEDLDKVLRQKPTTVRGVKKQRPKTVFRDDSVLSNSPVKGNRLNKVYSHSTLNLSSMANDSRGLTVRKSPSQSHSPSRSRLMSPGRMSAQNGEKDWENGSTISSPASIPEYTGPKLYKEPSFKSNKFIIHNAITRCCLAGKVNEPQKNKIVEEMEKSTANHFLILFRDTSCQFRAVYTMNPETEEMVRLTGIGPRNITPEMVESIYKYSSDRKQFTVIPSKTMSMSVDAFTIPNHFWQKRPGTPKKLSTPK